MPLADGPTYWYATRAPTRAVPDDPAARLAVLRTRYADCPAVGALQTATEPAAVHVTETTRLGRPLPALVRHLVALLGDAAHATTPTSGRAAVRRSRTR